MRPEKLKNKLLRGKYGCGRVNCCKKELTAMASLQKHRALLLLNP
jgi:cell fate regulator YaaT (PSP1 superfamily)